MKPTPKTYRKFKGYFSCVKNRVTGSVISVVDAEKSGLDRSAGKWAVVCETHNTIHNFRNLKLAREHSVDPFDWCDECLKIFMATDCPVHGKKFSPDCLACVKNAFGGESK